MWGGVGCGEWGCDGLLSLYSPTKQDFIVAKYKYLMLLPRPSQKDHVNSIEDLSRVSFKSLPPSLPLSLSLSLSLSSLFPCSLLKKIQISLSLSFMQQLHASVRTGNLETCLRLLSLGANPNYVNPVSHSAS